MYRQLFSLWEIFLGLLLDIVETARLNWASTLSYDLRAYHKVTIIWPTSSKVGCASKNFIIKWKLYTHDRTQASLESISKLQEKICPNTCIVFVACSLLPSRYLLSHGICWERKRQWGPALMMILHGYKHHAEVESKGITDNERHQQKKFSQWEELWDVQYIAFRKKWPGVWLFIELWAIANG